MTSTSSTNAENDEQKSEMRFKGYGILFFWILPVFISLIYVRFPILWIIITGIIIVVGIITRGELPIISNVLFVISRFTFGADFNKPDKHIIRTWWFLLFGGFLSGFLIFIVSYSSIFVIPLLLVIYKRREFLRFMYFIAFLPRQNYTYYQLKETREKKKSLLEKFSKEDRHYSLFFKPTRTTHIIAYLLIIILPFGLSTLLIPISFFYRVLFLGVRGSSSLSLSIGRFITDLIILAFIAIIPYVILFLPIFGKSRPSKVIPDKLGKFLIDKTTTNSGIGSLPMFKGEFFVERESEIIDLSSPTGFLEIFRNSRWLAILLIPLGLISLVLRFTVFAVIDEITKRPKINTGQFLKIFRGKILNQQLFHIAILILVPLVLLLILPLIFVLRDSEIKKTTWNTSDKFGQSDEITSVTDMGSIIYNIVSGIFGISAILNLSNTIQFLLIQSSPINTWMVTLTILIYSSAIVLPGTLFFVYQYFASGDHSHNVNSIRVYASESNNIAIGTVNRAYSTSNRLVDPPEDLSNHRSFSDQI